MMDIRQNVSLKDYSTMRLGGTAAYMTNASSPEDVKQAITWAEDKGLEVLMIGGGSNIFWRDEGFPGLIIINDIKGFDRRQEDQDIYLTVGAGENWDEVVARTTAEGLTGIECLSLIPGTAGATPVQNVGAYGQDIAQTLVNVEAYDRQTGKFVNIDNTDCAFGYRMSRFKSSDRGRFFITSVTLRLKRGQQQPPFYGSLQSYLDENGIHKYTPQTIRDAVIAIRSSKLPDPATVANNGSFFANPVITGEHLARLQQTYTDIPSWSAGDNQVKVPAAWLIERAGFKAVHDEETGMATWAKQPLVLVNEHAQSTAQLLEFRQKIMDAIQQKFDIILQQEPELLP